MDESIVEIDTRIAAAPATSGQAMTSRTSPMFMGATMDTDWMPGSAFRLHGRMGGRRFADFGEIETADAPKELTSRTGRRRARPAESYNFLRVRIVPSGDASNVTLSQFHAGRHRPTTTRRKPSSAKTGR